MKYLVYIFSALNIYLGIRFLLNVIGILQTSKYSPTANIIFSVLLLSLASLALYVSISKGNNAMALLLNASPWIISLILLTASMLFGDYK